MRMDGGWKLAPVLWQKLWRVRLGLAAALAAIGLICLENISQSRFPVTRTKTAKAAMTPAAINIQFWISTPRMVKCSVRNCTDVVLIFEQATRFEYRKILFLYPSWCGSCERQNASRSRAEASICKRQAGFFSRTSRMRMAEVSSEWAAVRLSACSDATDVIRGRRAARASKHHKRRAPGSVMMTRQACSRRRVCLGDRAMATHA
jgi:hypothetical protein